VAQEALVLMGTTETIDCLGLYPVKPQKGATTANPEQRRRNPNKHG